MFEDYYHHYMCDFVWVFHSSYAIFMLLSLPILKGIKRNTLEC